MKLITCPDVLTGNRKSSLFLGGGISNCPDWQSEMVERLSDTPLTLINPRRSNFNVNDPSLLRKQIEWEYNHLLKAKAILFFFPAESVCPITLFELGKWFDCSTKKIFVATDYKYSRRFDVVTQLELGAPNLHVYNSLERLTYIVKLTYELSPW